MIHIQILLNNVSTHTTSPGHNQYLGFGVDSGWTYTTSEDRRASIRSLHGAQSNVSFGVL